MARDTGSVCRQCRREGMKLFLKGERCFTDKCAIERRNYPPGDHGQGRHKYSEYYVQLREKQKVKRIYGVLERQFRRYFEMAERSALSPLLSRLPFAQAAASPVTSGSVSERGDCST